MKPYYEEPDIKIYQGHILEVLKTLDDESVNTIITSPPYWGLRDYGKDTKIIWDDDSNCEHNWNKLLQGHHLGQVPQTKDQVASGSKDSGQFCSKCGAWYGQLGLEPTLDLYISHLLQVTAELKRVLRKDGIMFWNQGDSYGGNNSRASFGGRAGFGTPREGVFNIAMAAKCLCLQNFRLILKMIDEQGWILRNSIIWNKPNHMPSSVKDRFSNAYEPVFMLVKNNDPVYYYNVKTGLMADRKPRVLKERIDWDWKIIGDYEGDVFNVRVRDADKGRFMEGATKEEKKNYKKGKFKKVSYWKSLDYWFDLDAVRKPYTPSGIERHEKCPVAKFTMKDGKPSVNTKNTTERVFIPLNPSGKNPGDVWTIPTQPFPEAHFATFPEDLVKPMILAGCPRWVCKKCGKARVRITKQNYRATRPGLNTGTGKSGSNNDPNKSLHQRDISKYRQKIDYQTVGWTDCGCNAGWDPGIVLDPFVGAGAVLRVAKNLGYAAIGIDIKKDYCDMSVKRAKNITPNLPFEG